jgi:hypothetical protein
VVSRGPHLVGHAEPFGAFAGALTGLDSGRSAALALAGERGIGTTCLLGVLAARADACGELVDALDACMPAEPAGWVTGRTSCSWTSSASPSGLRVRVTMHNRLSGNAG